jgi:hypothetical protein
MPIFNSWSPAGIAALVLIVAGIGLLVAYAMRRGLVDRELEGIDAPSEPGTEAPAPAEAPAVAAAASRVGSRTVGALGAVLLVAGLGLGVVAAVASWTSPVPGGPGTAPGDCAQGWNGCPRDTPKP